MSCPISTRTTGRCRIATAAGSSATRWAATAAAWSPNPNTPPLYLDLPIGPNQQSVLARWAANAPLAFIDQYIQKLRQYRAIAIDVGDQDNLKVDSGKLHDVLTNYE